MNLMAMVKKALYKQIHFGLMKLGLDMEVLQVVAANGVLVAYII